MQVYEILTTGNLKEITKHGDKSFPLAIYKTMLRKNKLGYVQLHWHDEIQFALVTKGCVNFTIDKSEHIVEKNNGIFINSNCLHSAKSYNNNDSEYICIDISPELFLGSSESIIRQKYIEPFLKSKAISFVTLNLSIDWEKKILKSLKDLYMIYEEKNFGFELKMQYVILNILHLMIINIKYLDKEISSYSFIEDQRIKKMLSYIEENYNQKITLEDMAKNANLSRAECSRFFKRMTGQTPFEYLISYRINKSALLLRNSDMPITEIAEEVGFGSVSYYIEKFRKQTNCTPTEFRNFHPKFIES
ncbi:AraC family transcriptional regulator [Clostridium sp. P21]|uniref:AraC family transcriptional regulator n=1 Tax=Clostridium muellerianum TaxID=2716538 RepID=A0A7Y0HQ68_9CLOT|nr:AraC family transcriptional regulator [Clostridium muellerianum]NMM64427.1 AraC family transcriptional regulator [Clostridium muellerianum]